METISSGISKLEINGSTAVLTIENGKKNLLTEPEFIELDVLRNAVESNPQLTSFVITGAGRHFSHGADVSLFDSEEAGSSTNAKLERSKELLSYIENLPMVTAAAINGGCFGGGLEIALSCQFRICSKSAVLGLPEIMHGVIPGMCGIERLTRLVGKRKAVSMILSGEMITASDAYEIGIVDKISEDKNCLEETVRYVTGLTEGKSALQIRAITGIANAAAGGSAENHSAGIFEKLLEARRGE